MVNNLRKIAIHYIKGSFIFDFIAIIPFQFLLNENYGTSGANKNDKFRILKLFRLLRLARLGELLKIERFKQVVNDYYNHKLEKAVAKRESNFSYPILRALFLV